MKMYRVDLIFIYILWNRYPYYIFKITVKAQKKQQQFMGEKKKKKKARTVSHWDKSLYMLDLSTMLKAMATNYHIPQKMTAKLSHHRGEMAITTISRHSQKT